MINAPIHAPSTTLVDVVVTAVALVVIGFLLYKTWKENKKNE